MTHERIHEEQEELLPPSNRSFGLTFTIAFALLGIVYLYRHGEIRWWPWAMAAMFGAITWLFPQVLTGPSSWWLRFGLLLSRIVSPAAMALLFYAVITPIGLLMRLSGKAVMRSPFDPETSSYWVIRRPPGPPPASLDKQF